MLYNMGAGNSTAMTNPLASSIPTSVNQNQARINQTLLEAQTAININDLVTAKSKVDEVIALGALKTDVNLLKVAEMLRNKGVYVGGKRRKSKRYSKSKRKTRRKQRN